MALLNEGSLIYEGTPDKLVELARGHVWRSEVTQLQYEQLKEEVPIISTIPSGGGWEIQFVGEKPAYINATEVDPNLEHAYVYYMDHKLEHWDLS
jgi:ABC-2 type transport system ATP-binding protein